MSWFLPGAWQIRQFTASPRPMDLDDFVEILPVAGLYERFSQLDEVTRRNEPWLKAISYGLANFMRMIALPRNTAYQQKK